MNGGDPEQGFAQVQDGPRRPERRPGYILSILGTGIYIFGTVSPYGRGIQGAYVTYVFHALRTFHVDTAVGGSSTPMALRPS